jgi:hypothetical protein
MAALTGPRKMTVQSEGRPIPPLDNFPVKGGVKIWQGALVVLNAGYAAPGSTATGLIVVGRAKVTVDNTSGGDGAQFVDVEPGEFSWNNSASGDLIAQAQVGTTCYIVDDNTVAKTNGSSSRSAGGIIKGVNADGSVRVLSGLGITGV